MVRLALALALAAAPLAAAEPPPVAQEEDAEQPPTPNDTIRPGKRPLLKLTGTPEAEEPPPAKEPRQPPPPAPAPSPEAPKTVHPSTYKGVSIGGEHLPPRPPRLPVAGPARVTWPGFQVRDGVPTVFVELTGPVEWSVEEKPGELTYLLKNTVIHLRNNRRPLDVKEFKTVVKEVDARAVGRDVRVTVRLRGKAAHHERVEDAAGGFKLLVVELGP